MGVPVSLPLFVYGTLTIPEVLKVLLGRVPRGERATARGYRARLVSGAPYPGLMEASGESVGGLLLDDLAVDELYTIDRYEDDLYALGDIRVVSGGREVECAAYLVEGTGLDLLSEEPWDPEVFLRDELKKYLSALQGWLCE